MHALMIKGCAGPPDTSIDRVWRASGVVQDLQAPRSSLEALRDWIWGVDLKAPDTTPEGLQTRSGCLEVSAGSSRPLRASRLDLGCLGRCLEALYTFFMQDVIT